MDYMNHWWWGPGFGWIFMVLFWVLIILGIVALGRWLFSGRGGAGAGGPEKGPLDIVKERYARGEITREQYEQMRRDLQA
jgi:putative membrane protein